MVTVDRAAQEDRASAAEQDRQLRAGLPARGARIPRAGPPQLIAVGGLSGTGKTHAGRSARAGARCPRPARCTCAATWSARPCSASPRPCGCRPRPIRPRRAKRLRPAVQEGAPRAGGRAVRRRRCGVRDDRTSDRRSKRSLPSWACRSAGLWLTAAGDELAARVAARRNDASDATPEFVARQLTWDTGALSPAWTTLDAGAGPDETLRRAHGDARPGADRPEFGKTARHARRHDHPQFRLPAAAAIGRADRRQHQARQRRPHHGAKPARRRVCGAGLARQSEVRRHRGSCLPPLGRIAAGRAGSGRARHAAGNHPRR